MTVYESLLTLSIGEWLVVGGWWSVVGETDSRNPAQSEGGKKLSGEWLVMMTNLNPYFLCKQLSERCVEKKVTLALTESCTGGLLSSWITELAGVSHWFMGSAVVYDNTAKKTLLNVDPQLLTRFGAVSEPVAKAMAEGARLCFGATLALSITGIAGPSGGSHEKPVGTVCFGLADARQSSVIVQQKCFSGGRTNIRREAAFFALQWLCDLLNH